MWRYVLFGILLMGVMFLGFEAGKKGLDKSTPKTSGKPFRSFPLLSDPKKEESLLQKNGEIQKPVTPEEKKTEEKKLEEKKVEENKVEEIRKVEEKNSATEDVENPSVSRMGSFSDIVNYLLFLDHQKEKNKEKSSNLRVKTLPQFSTIYLPVYADNQLGTEALQGFSTAFPGQTISQKRFVLEKEIATSSKGSRYQVMVYDISGKQFLGSFETMESVAFPFRGIPIFTSVEDTNLFPKNSRFIIISDSDKDITNFLNHEPYLHSILKTAYRHELNAQTFLGNHKESNLNIYTIFPGVFLALR